MRPVDADGLKELFNSRSSHPIYDEWSTLGILGVIDEMPTIDVAVVRHGRFISELVKKCDWRGKTQEYYQPHSCSCCHTPLYGTEKYCPACGAKMDGSSNK